jgi:hypothetical protein
MADTSPSPQVIRREAVRLVRQPALVACGNPAAQGQGSLAVVPLLDGDRVAGFEIRCSCGSTALVECVYPEEVKS